jgi:hypothetical protein
MFIASTVNATSTSGNDVPVIVLTYGEESCLVKLPLAYEACNCPYLFLCSLLITKSLAGLERLDDARFWY